MVVKELQNNGRIVCFANEYLTVEYHIFFSKLIYFIYFTTLLVFLEFIESV